MTGDRPPRVRVRRPGALTTIQDCGRPGYAHVGVPRSGALDAPAHHLANQLVGNPPGAAVLETTLTGVALVAEARVTVAVTGAVAEVRVDGAGAPLRAAITLRPGQVLDVGPARQGVRSYVALSGGLLVPRVLGSASTDLLSGLGPPQVAAGDVLELGKPAAAGGAGGAAAASPANGTPANGSPAAGSPAAESPAAGGPAAGGPGAGAREDDALAGGLVAACWAADALTPVAPGEQAELVIRLGPRDDWLSAAGRAALRDGSWTVSPQSNRVALRLSGPPAGRSRLDELPSEGLVTGAVQTLPDGQLVVFLADHPVTGGYPVVAVVEPESLSACAQGRPGTVVRFRVA